MEITALRALAASGDDGKKQALEKLRPEGERSISGEWTLYNLIDLKFFEKQKVKDIVRRLSMSEADFYRKQKVAVEALSKEIIRMEHSLQDETGDGLQNDK